MFCKLLGALVGVCLSTSASFALPIFDGIFQYISATNNCGTVGSSYEAVYRPQIVATDPNSGLVVSLYRSGIGFARTNDGQFSGAGQFAGVYLTSQALVVDRIGSYTITQSPATVTNATQAVTLTGNFTPTVGCRYVFKATFLRRPGS